MLTLDIVIVNWNSGTLLQECIRSLAPACRHVALDRVIVVDNASTDESAAALSSFDPLVEVQRNRTNRGFAAACNQGALGSETDLILFLNPDTRLFEDSLSTPMRFMTDASSASVGICGIQLVDQRGEVARTCVRFPSASQWTYRALGLDRLMPRRFPPYFLPLEAHRHSGDVDQVIGAFFMVRRRVFEELGGFDERFFVYFEELDFSLRAHRAGYRSRFLAEARALHVGGGTTDRVRATRLFYVLQSRLQFGTKHYGPAANAGLTATTLVLEPAVRVLHALLRASLHEAAGTARAWMKLLWWAISARALRR